MKKAIKKVNVLMEALPYIKSFFNKTIVIKYGGQAMIDENLKYSFASDIVLLRYIGMKPVIIHGGGPQITRVMERMGKKTEFVDGLRVTDKETMEIVEMVLGGKISTEIVSLINQNGGQAVGLSGVDGRLIKAQRSLSNKVEHTGEVVEIRSELLEVLDNAGFIPVIAPIGIGEDGERYNVNADTVAAEIALAIKAHKLIILTDVKGILQDINDAGSLISTINVSEIKNLIRDRVINKGMIPKILSCQKAVVGNISKAHIIDGRIPHSILLELFTNEGIGSQIVK